MVIAENQTESASLPEAKPEAKKPAKRRKTSKDYAIEFFIKVGVTVAVVLILCFLIVGIHVNHGNSSYPMIKDGDLVVTYRLAKLSAGDEIAYKVGDALKFGRIVAVGGDEVNINDAYVMVNGYGIAEDAVFPTSSEGSAITYPYVVPERNYFVLNDYRSDVDDSRTFGAVHEENIEGKVVFIARRRGI